MYKKKRKEKPHGLVFYCYLIGLVGESLFHFWAFLLACSQSIVIEAFNFAQLTFPHFLLLLIDLQSTQKKTLVKSRQFNTTAWYTLIQFTTKVTLYIFVFLAVPAPTLLKPWLFCCLVFIYLSYFQFLLSEKVILIYVDLFFLTINLHWCIRHHLGAP